MPLALLAALLAASPVKLAVVELNAPPPLIGLADELTEDLLAAARAERLSAIGPDRLQDAIGAAAYGSLADCGLAPECVSELLRPTGAGRAVIGSLDHDAHDYLVKLWLVDLASGKVIAAVDRAIPIAAQRLREDVDASLPQLLRGEGEAHGTLLIASDVPGARVEIDGREVGATPLTLALKPGEHQLHAELEGHLSVDRLANVEPGRRSTLALRMLAFPSARPDRVVAAASAAHPAAVGAAPSAAAHAAASQADAAHSALAPTLPTDSGLGSPAVTAQGPSLPTAAIVALAGSGLAALGGVAFAVSARRLDQRLVGLPGSASAADVAAHRRTAAATCVGLSIAGLLAAGVLTYEARLGAAQAQLSVGPRGVALAGAF